MGLYFFGPILFFKVKYLKKSDLTANSSPVADSTLHTAKCTLHTAPGPGPEPEHAHGFSDFFFIFFYWFKQFFLDFLNLF